MSGPARWIAEREPPAVVSLEAWLSEDGAASPDDLVGSLTAHGIRALDRARANPGRVRESAFDLLAADALLTYACEAALEADDVESALHGILRSVCER